MYYLSRSKKDKRICFTRKDLSVVFVTSNTNCLNISGSLLTGNGKTGVFPIFLSRFQIKRAVRCTDRKIDLHFVSDHRPKLKNFNKISAWT